MLPNGTPENKESTTTKLFLILFVPNPNVIFEELQFGQTISLAVGCDDISSFALSRSLSSILICTPAPNMPLNWGIKLEKFSLIKKLLIPLFSNIPFRRFASNVLLQVVNIMVAIYVYFIDKFYGYILQICTSAGHPTFANTFHAYRNYLKPNSNHEIKIVVFIVFIFFEPHFIRCLLCMLPIIPEIQSTPVL
jgi:hypothetical protein